MSYTECTQKSTGNPHVQDDNIKAIPTYATLSVGYYIKISSIKHYMPPGWTNR